MLLNLTTLVKKYGLKITGVIHVGAHYGEEVPEYFALGIKNIALIEPCAKAFNVLKQKFGAHHHIQLLNYACAAINGDGVMHTETANKGQSNSLLKPVKHLDYYPEIKFNGMEPVKIRRMDSLGLANKYNMINMDVQGAEGGVIVGASGIMQHIDYVYTEVNKDGANLYQGATPVSELDRLLGDFTRVEASWTDQGWGDALYIRNAKM